MKKKNSFINKWGEYLASDKGVRFLNYCYNWGASVLILGAMFKILHWPYANEMLMVAMIVESFVFFISAFEKPWDNKEQKKEIAEQTKGYLFHAEDFSKEIGEQAQLCKQQLELLNRNLNGLNHLYEVQVIDINTQIDTIRHLNKGLKRINELYERSLPDSDNFRKETEMMAQQLKELNQVYSRILKAMTVNMKSQFPDINQP